MLAEGVPKGRRYRFGDAAVDCSSFTVEYRGQTRSLSPRAFDVLLYLIEHQDRVVGKEELFEQIWKESFVTDAALTQVIKEVRHAINDDAHTPRYIETIHKRGYRFIAPVEPVATVYDRRPDSVLAERRHRGAWRWTLALVLAIAFVTGALILALNVAGLRDRVLGSSSPRTSNPSPSSR